MLTNLHLLFIARQGYWTQEKEVAPKHLILYVLPYLAWSVFLLGAYFFFKTEVLNFLASYQFYGLFSYLKLSEYLLYLIVPLGIFYEVVYLVKAKTLETMQLFFAVPRGQLAWLVLVRNFLIVLPALVAGLFFNTWLPYLLFILGHYISFPLVRVYYRFLTNRTKYPRNFGSDIRYIRTVVDDLSLLKCFLLPLASLLLFFLWARTGSDLDLLSPNKTSPIFTAIFIGSVVFYPKSPSYLFLSLWQDFPYLQVLRLNLVNFLWPKLVMMALLSYSLVAVPFLVFYTYQGASLWQLGVLALCLFLVYSLLQSFQWRESLFFKGKHFVHAKEIEHYRLPLVYYLRRLLLSLSLTTVAFIFTRQFSLLSLLSFVLASLVIQVINYRFFFKHYQY